MRVADDFLTTLIVGAICPYVLYSHYFIRLTARKLGNYHAVSFSHLLVKTTGTYPNENCFHKKHVEPRKGFMFLKILI